MEDGLMAVIITVLFLFCFISGPVYTSLNEEDVYINNYIKVITNNFQNEVRKDGYIDVENYYNFLRNLNASTRVYYIELIHTSRLIYPKGEDAVQIKYVEHGNKEILDAVLKNKKYYMRYGDDFSVKITEKQQEPSRLLQRSIYFIDEGCNKYLSFKFGGMVENEDF